MLHRLSTVTENTAITIIKNEEGTFYTNYQPSLKLYGSEILMNLTFDQRSCVIKLGKRWEIKLFLKDIFGLIENLLLFVLIHLCQI